MLVKIHVNRHNVAHNKKNGFHSKPVFTVKTYKETVTCHRVDMLKETYLKESEKPLSCGAHVWIETYGPVVCYDAKGKAFKTINPRRLQPHVA